MLHLKLIKRTVRKLKKSNKTFVCKYNLRSTNEIMLRRKPIYFCRYSTRARQRALTASRKQQHRKKTNKLGGQMIIVNYYPSALCRVQITPKTSTNITRYSYSRGPVRQVCLVLLLLTNQLAGFPIFTRDAAGDASRIQQNSVFSSWSQTVFLF